jgi:sulfonate transport system permease protein
MNSKAGRVVRNLLLGLWLPVVIVVVWWYTSSDSKSLFFPPLRNILRQFRELWLFKNTRSQLVPSLEHLAGGLAIAAGVGIVVGVFLWAVPGVRAFLSPLFNFFRSLPAPALIPGFIAVLGIGARMEVAVIAVGCVWPVLLSTMDGLAGADRLLRETAQVYHLPTSRTIWSVMLRSASPQIAAGLRTALQSGIVLMVVSEMLGATSGIGYFILSSQQTFDTAQMWSGMIALGIVGTLLNLLFITIERRALKWFYGARAAERTA